MTEPSPGRPPEERANGSALRWIVGIVVVLLAIWIIAGLFTNGIDDDPIAPPLEEEPAPPPPQQPQQQQPQQQNEEGASTSEGSTSTVGPVTVSIHEMDAAVHWPEHLVHHG